MVIHLLENATLLKAVKVKTETGNNINFNYLKINDYRIQKQVLNDEITATIYGTNINKMLRISTPLRKLEKFLMPKVDNVEDNINLYYIEYNNKKYKIVACRDNYLDIERV